MNNSPKTIMIKNPRKTIFAASGATLVAIGIIVVISVSFGKSILDLEFMTDRAYASDQVLMQAKIAKHEARFDDQVAGLTIQQSVQGEMLEHHIKDFRQMVTAIAIADAVDLYNNADEALYLQKRYETKDGITPSSAERRDTLIRRKDSAKEYRDCVLAEKPNCKALRPQ